MSSGKQRITKAEVRRYRASPVEFFGDVLIPAADGIARFVDVWADFQVDTFRAIEPCLQAVARGKRPPLRGFWLERTKGGSKDSDVGLCLMWLLLFSPRPLWMEAGADDQEQAQETHKAMIEVARLNPWINRRLTFHKTRVFCEQTGSNLEFLTTDRSRGATGAHGSRPAVTVCNELSHVGSQAFIQTMLDNASKIPTNLSIICTNAGQLRTWQRKWREKYQVNPRWYFQTMCKPAPWLDPQDIEEARGRNGPSRFARLWFGAWTSGEGDALDPNDITACIKRKKQPPVRDGFVYLAGLDLGVKLDHAALVVLGTEVGSGRVELASSESWAPSQATGKVDLLGVEAAVLAASRTYGLYWIGYDPHQAQLMAQRCERAGLEMTEISFAAGWKLDRMARELLQATRQRLIDLYDDPALIDDLHRLTLVERRYGYKLEATRDETGHADRATALAIVLPAALEVSQIEPPEGDDAGPMRIVA